MELPTSPVSKVNPTQSEVIVPNITLEQTSSQYGKQTSSSEEKTNEVSSDDETSISEMDSSESNNTADPSLPPPTS
jgi:hypothetical protein